MKKFFMTLLTAALLLQLCACGGKAPLGGDSPAPAPETRPQKTAEPLPAAEPEDPPREPDAPAPEEAPETAPEELPEEVPAEDPPEEAPELTPAAFTPRRHRVCAGASACAVLLNDGTISCSLDRTEDMNVVTDKSWYGWTDVVDLTMDEEILAAVRADGTVVWDGGRKLEYDWLNDPETMGVIASWRNAVQVSAGPFDVAVLCADGSVEVTGSIWTEDLEETDGFTQVAVYDALFALRADGTVYCYAPYVYEGQDWVYDVSSWTDVTQISAGYDHAAGLRADGTVVTSGCNDYGQCDTADWTDVVQVCAGRSHTIGLKADGTLLWAGEPFYDGNMDFLNWTDVVEISGFFDQVAALRSDGSVLYAGPAERLNPAYVSSLDG